MRYTILFSIFLFAILTGCKKTGSNSAPTLTFKSVNSTNIQNGDIVQFTLSFTGQEGQSGDSIFVEENVPNCPASSFVATYAIPSFPAAKNQKGNIIVTFGYNSSQYQNISPQCQENDTAVFRFALYYGSGLQVSDTVSSPPIVINYP